MKSIPYSIVDFQGHWAKNKRLGLISSADGKYNDDDDGGEW